MIFIWVLACILVILVVCYIYMKKKINFVKANLLRESDLLSKSITDNDQLKFSLQEINKELAEKEKLNLALSIQQKNDQQKISYLNQKNIECLKRNEELFNNVKEINDKYILVDTLSKTKEKEINKLLQEIESINKEKDYLINELAKKQKIIAEQNLKDQIKISTLEKQLEVQEESIKDKIKLLSQSKEILSEQFENLANRIFEEKGNNLVKQNKLNLSEISQVFKHDIGDFKKKIEDVYMQEAKERVSLQKEVNKLFDLNQVMNKEARNLTRALKGDKKIQGNWGEVVLEKVLESSGLRKDHEYQVQNSFKSSENFQDKLYRPDVIIKLPDGKDIIIDSKVSLVSYEQYVNTEDETDKSISLKKHINALHQHVKLLSNKNYENLYGVNSLDFILMFIPIESAFVSAFQSDKSLFHDAFSKRIIIVTPTTLLATLGTIRNTWKYDNLNKNANEISNRASKMLDKFRGFVSDLENLGIQIEKSKECYSSMLNKLTLGRGNLISQAIQLQDMGVEMKKNLSKNIIDKTELD